jgi:TRAP-type uncharacterized transport system fused permease subunit
MDVEPMAAHLFAFYFGLVSSITPPVALASFAAAGISGADPMKTGFHSMRLGIAKYILPFVFVAAPGLLFVGSWDQILLAITGTFAGIYALTVTTEGWCLTKARWPLRIFMGVCALMFFMPGLDLAFLGIGAKLPQWLTQLSAWALFAVLIFVHRGYAKRVLAEAAS